MSYSKIIGISIIVSSFVLTDTISYSKIRGRGNGVGNGTI